MTFVDSNGNQLNFDGEFAITKQSISAFDFSIKGDVSINFSIDNNSQNRKVLNYYGPQMLNQVAWTKQPFKRIAANGNIIDYGYIVIQDENELILNCFYLSGNSNWINLMSRLINALDYTGVTNGRDYRVKWNYTNAIDTTPTDGIIFPFIDWSLNHEAGNIYYNISKYLFGQVVDETADYLSSPLVQFYPCFYLKSLLTEIIKQTGLKINGNLLNDSLFNSLVVSPYSGDFKTPLDIVHIISLKGTSQHFISVLGTDYQYTSFTAAINNDGLWASNKFTASYPSTYSVTATASGTANIDLRVYKNGVFSVGYNSLSNTTQKNNLVSDISLNTGEYLEFYVRNSITTPFDCILDITIQDLNSTYNLVSPSDFLPSYTCLDIIKFIVNYFGCSIYFDSTSKSMTINIIEKMDQTNAMDWSNYYLGHRSEYTVNQAQNNYYSWSDSIDTTIVAYNSLNKVKYGGGNITTGNTLKAENDLPSFKFIPSLPGTNLNGIYTSSSPLITLQDSGEALHFNNVSAYSGTIGAFLFDDVTILINSCEIVRLTTQGGVNLGYFISPLGTNTAGNVNLYYTFTANFTGYIYRQKISYNSNGPFLLSVKPNTSLINIGTQSSVFYNDGSTNNTISSVNYATFTKEHKGLTIDQWKNNLAIDNPNSNYTDPTMKELYYNKISSFLQNPNIRCSMLLPQAVYQSFDFSRLIYLKTENLTGYFFVVSIVNYINSNTPVEVNLYMI